MVELQLIGVAAGMLIAAVLVWVTPNDAPGVARDCFVPRNDPARAGQAKVVVRGVSGSVLMKAGHGALAWLLLLVVWLGVLIMTVCWWLVAWIFKPVRK